MGLEGKSAIVTGASSGIGAAIALRLAQDGADVMFTYIHDKQGAKNTKRGIEQFGSYAYMQQVDFERIDDIYTLTKCAKNKMGRVDILVNNAGVFIDQPFFDITEEGFDKTISVNLKAYFFLTQEVAKIMKKQQIHGRIINISSGGTKHVSGINTSYVAAKGGVNAMTKSMADSLGSYGITVNAILPGPIKTKLNAHQFEDKTMRDNLLAATKLREFGEANYIAAAVSYYASEQAKWTTGTLLSVDGGFTCN